MTRFERIRSMELGELAELMEDAGNIPWCGSLESCLEELNGGREIPEERCRACVIGWLLGEYDGREETECTGNM